MKDTIKNEITISSMFDPIFHVTNSGELIDVSLNSDVMSDVVVVLESEHCRDSFNVHKDL